MAEPDDDEFVRAMVGHIGPDNFPAVERWAKAHEAASRSPTRANRQRLEMAAEGLAATLGETGVRVPIDRLATAAEPEEPSADASEDQQLDAYVARIYGER